MSKICPFLSTAGNAPQTCRGYGCALWVPTAETTAGKCALVSLAMQAKKPTAAGNN